MLVIDRWLVANDQLIKYHTSSSLVPSVKSYKVILGDVSRCQQAFLASLPGKVARHIKNVDRLILINVIEITINPCSSRITRVLSTLISYAG